MADFENNEVLEEEVDEVVEVIDDADIDVIDADDCSNEEESSGFGLKEGLILAGVVAVGALAVEGALTVKDKAKEKWIPGVKGWIHGIKDKHEQKKALALKAELDELDDEIDDEIEEEPAEIEKIEAEVVKTNKKKKK